MFGNSKYFSYICNVMINGNMKKISSGYYKTVINGFDIEIIRTIVEWSNEVVWYSIISSDEVKVSEGTDYYPTKKECLIAATYVANHPEEYGITAPKKTIWHWVIGDTKKGFKIVTKLPKHKFVREPFESNEAAQRFIAYEYSINA
ncbi:MAG: hypothetical protein RLZZ546_1066 [Bacteroidota bacterium]|jgi:hypothetical protein